ncbi:hypothetical protein [Edwardsiella tarda]
MKPRYNTLFLLLSSALLTACGGGGGGGGDAAQARAIAPAPTAPKVSPSAAQPIPAAPTAPKALPSAAQPIPAAPTAPEVRPSAAQPIPAAPTAPEVRPNAAQPIPAAPTAPKVLPSAAQPVPAAPTAPEVHPNAAQPIPAAPTAPEVRPSAAFGEPEAVYEAYLREIGPHDAIHISGFNALSPDSEFTVKVKGTNIAIEVTPPIKLDEKDSRAITGQRVLTLRDADGKLAGYYGYVHTYTHRETAQNEDDQDQTTTSLVYAVNASDRRRPETQADYVGTLFYNHFDIPREAAIRLHYQDNKITGAIKGTGLASDIDYVIRDDGDNTVSDEGTFGARLHRVNAQRNAVNGHIVGGFYGKEGEVAAGEVNFIDDYSVERGGAFGAQRVKRD